MTNNTKVLWVGIKTKRKAFFVPNPLTDKRTKQKIAPQVKFKNLKKQVCQGNNGGVEKIAD